MAIKYEASPVLENVFRTQKFGNLLSDTYSAQVELSEDGTWLAWFTNHSRDGMNVNDEPYNGLTHLRFGFKSKTAAIRWANKMLRRAGLKD